MPSRLESKGFFLVLAVTLHMMIKSLKIILHWCLRYIFDDKTKQLLVSISNLYPKELPNLRREAMS